MHYHIIDLFGERDATLSSSMYSFCNRSMDITIALFGYEDFRILAIMKRYPAPSLIQSCKDFSLSDVTNNALFGIGIFFDELYCNPSR